MLLLKSFTTSNLMYLYSYYVFKNTSYKPYGNLEGKREVVGKSNKRCQDFIISVRLGIPNSEEHILTQMPYFQNLRIQQDAIYWERVRQLSLGSLKHPSHYLGNPDLVPWLAFPPLRDCLRLMKLSFKEHMSVLLGG